jgi:phosphoglucomutase
MKVPVKLTFTSCNQYSIYQTDFGIKWNVSNGGPAPESVTDGIFKRTTTIDHYWSVENSPHIDVSTVGSSVKLLDTQIVVIDSVADYAELMESIFDFNAIRALFSSGFSIRFDALNAVSGPYAVEIFEKRLGARSGSAVNAKPLPDFGGLHPDPNPIYAHSLVEHMHSAGAPDFGAARCVLSCKRVSMPSSPYA